MGFLRFGRAAKIITRLGRRQGALGRAIRVVRRVVVAVIIGFVVNVVAISVACAGRQAVTIDPVTIRTRFIETITIRVSISVRMTPVRITIAIAIQAFLIRAVRSVVIRIVVEARRVLEVLGSFQSFLQD